MLLRPIAKSLVITAGFAYGIARGLQSVMHSAGNSSVQKEFDARISTLEMAVAGLGDQTRYVEARAASSVTRSEYLAGIEDAVNRVRFDTEIRFEQNARSIEALRDMVVQTDELLQKVLDGLEELREAHDAVH